MYTADTKVRVRYAETDQMGVVYHGNYAAYFETARTESIRQLGLTYREMEAAGIFMPVVEIHTRFLRPAHYDDLLTVKTILKEWPEGHRIKFHQEIYNEQGKLITGGTIVLYFMDIKKMTKVRMPKELSEKLQPYFTL